METNSQQKIILRQSKFMVFTRAASPFFQCRIKLSAKPYVYKSLNTVDEAEARQLGEDLYAKAKFNAESGGTDWNVGVMPRAGLLLAFCARLRSLGSRAL